MWWPRDNNTEREDDLPFTLFHQHVQSSKQTFNPRMLRTFLKKQGRCNGCSEFPFVVMLSDRVYNMGMILQL